MSPGEESISIAVAASESYSVALCVSKYTLLENLSPEYRIDLYVMTDDIRAQIKRRLEQTWGKRVQPHWITPDNQKVCALVAAIARAGWADWRPQPLSVSQKAKEFFAKPHRRLMHLGSAVRQAKRRSHAMVVMLPEILKLTVLRPWTVFTVPLAVARDTTTLWLSR